MPVAAAVVPMEILSEPKVREEKIIQFSGAYSSGRFDVTLKEDTDALDYVTENGQSYIRTTESLAGGSLEVSWHNLAHLHVYSIIRTVRKRVVKPEKLKGAHEG